MKITTVQSNHSKDLSVLNGMIIQVNHLGEIEVEDEIGAQLLSKYPEIFFDPSVQKSTTDTKVKLNHFQEKVIKNLENEILVLKSQLTAKENQIKEAEADKAAWAVLAEENKVRATLAEESLEAEKAATQEIVKAFELKIKLIETPIDKIRKSLEKDSSFYPKEQWESLDKPALIQYLLEKK